MGKYDGPEYRIIKESHARDCFDADIGKDLTFEVREYYISGFTNWTDIIPSDGF